MNLSDDKSKKIPKEWRLWAEENIKNGSDPNDLIKEMEKAGFSPSQVRPFVFSIEIDKNTICLLYTSPSPRDLSTSRMPSSA